MCRARAEGIFAIMELANLRAIQDQGLIVLQKNPMLGLASYLSEFKDFRSAGQGIWTLAEPINSEAPTAEAVEAS